MPSVRAGDTVGRYRVLEELARGGSGVVYRARDERTGASVALKVLLATLDLEQRARFEREARALRALSHPYLVGLLDSGSLQGSPWIVLELVSGGSLAGALARRGSLPWAEAARHGAHIASALAAVHEAGFVHRDVKPGNVLLDERGETRLADLGLVRSIGVNESLTEAGSLLGTLEFIAPEQAEGSSEIDARADLYSLGATLHALVSGAPPFRGTGLALARAHLVQPPTPLGKLVPGVPHSLERLVLRLLAKAPADRPASASEVAAELEEIADSAGRLSPGARRATLVVLLVLLVGGGAAAGGLLLGRRRERVRREAEAAEHARHEAEAREAAARRWLDRAVPLATRGRLALSQGEPRAALAALDALLADAPPRALAGALPEPVRAQVARAEAESRIACARLALGLGEPARARTELARVQELDRTSAEAQALGAEAALLAHDGAAAASLSAEAVALDGQSPRARAARLQARALTEAGSELRKEAQALVEAAPGEAASWRALGAVDASLGRREETVAALTKALQMEPVNVWALSARGRALVEVGHAADALRDAERIAALAPTVVEGLLLRGQARAAMQDFGAALADLDEAARLAPAAAEVALARARALHGARRLDEAAAVAGQVLARAESLEARLVRAGINLARGACDDARSDARRATELAPGSGEAWLLLASAKRRLHDPGANEAADRALALVPDDLRALGVKIRIALDQEEGKTALELAEKLVARGRTGESLALRGLAQLVVAREKAAAEDIAAALAVDSYVPMPWIAAAELAERRSDVQGTLDAADRALSMTEDEGTRVIRAEARFLSGDARGALLDAEKVLATLPRDVLTLAIADLARQRLREPAKGPDGRALLDAAIAASPDWRGIPHAAGLARRARDFLLEREITRRAVARWPQVEALRLADALAASDVGDHEGAVAALDGLGAKRAEPSVLDVRAKALLELGQAEAALADARAAFEQKPSAEITVGTYALVLAATGHVAEADRLLSQWESAHGGQHTARILEVRIDLLLRLGRFQDARATAKAVLETLPDAQDTRVRGAEARRRLGDLDGALGDAEAVLRDAPRFAPALAVRGLVREGRGDLAGARADLEAALPGLARTFAFRDDAREALERLSKR